MSLFIILCRLPLPELKLSSTWNIQSSRQTIPIQERFFKFKIISSPPQRTLELDKVEARSSWFTELDSYWSLPIDENSTVAALTVSPGLGGNGNDDKIHVLTVNPLCLYNISTNSEKLQEINIQGLIAPLRGNRPHFSLAVDRNKNVLVHEETVSNILKSSLK